MVSNRKPLQVDPEFKLKIMQLKRKIEVIEKRDISIRELTKRIAKTENIEALERNLVGNNSIKLNIKVDKRLFGQ